MQTEDGCSLNEYVLRPTDRIGEETQKGNYSLRVTAHNPHHLNLVVLSKINFKKAIGLFRRIGFTDNAVINHLVYGDTHYQDFRGIIHALGDLDFVLFCYLFRQF